MKKSISLIIISIAIIMSCEKEEEVKQEPSACFTFTEAHIFTDSIRETTYTPASFSNCSENSTEYLWDFGDGTTSKDFEPVHQYMNDGEFIVSLEVSNNNGSDTYIDTLYVNWISVDKPNIYIYPINTIDLSVKLNFPQGGRILTSIPKINNNNWFVNIDSTGKIDQSYDYLFYESIQPDIWQYRTGWCIKEDSLEKFFITNMQTYNFNEKEISDFIEHWIPLLHGFEYYEIYPQTNTIIENVIEINFSIQPDNFGRLYYGIIGRNDFKEIPEATIEMIKRVGFTIVEWGVYRK